MACIVCMASFIICRKSEVKLLRLTAVLLCCWCFNNNSHIIFFRKGGVLSLHSGSHVLNLTSYFKIDVEIMQVSAPRP